MTRRERENYEKGERESDEEKENDEEGERK